MAGRTALITGASSGIGEALAHEFASHGFHIVLTARREDRLRALAQRLMQQHEVRVDMLPCDLAAPGGAAALCDSLQRRGVTIDALVSVAGFGTAGRFVAADWAVCANMLQLMVTSPTELLHRLLPGMLERHSGWVLNVASLGGLVSSGSGTLYEATKAFSVHLSTSLAREAWRHGVRVTVVCPGLTRTEFHNADGMQQTVSGMPRWMWMEPQAVAREGYAALMAGEPLVVTGRMNRLLLWGLRHVPRWLIISLGRRVMTAAHIGLRSTAW